MFYKKTISLFICILLLYPSLCLSNIKIELPLFVSGVAKSFSSSFSHIGIVGEPTVSRNITASNYLANCGWSFVIRKTPVIPLQTSHETDINCDGTLDLNDAIVGLKVLTDTKSIDFCTYSDSSIGFSDIILILNMIANHN